LRRPLSAAIPAVADIDSSRSLGGRPGTGLAASALAPPCANACLQRQTEAFEQPTRWETFLHRSPAFSSSTACRRRCSNVFAEPYGLMHHTSAFSLHYFYEIAIGPAGLESLGADIYYLTASTDPSPQAINKVAPDGAVSTVYTTPRPVQRAVNCDARYRRRKQRLCLAL